MLSSWARCISTLCDNFHCFFLPISCMVAPQAIPDLVDVLTDDMDGPCLHCWSDQPVISHATESKGETETRNWNVSFVGLIVHATLWHSRKMLFFVREKNYLKLCCPMLAIVGAEEHSSNNWFSNAHHHCLVLSRYVSQMIEAGVLHNMYFWSPRIVVHAHGATGCNASNHCPPIPL